MSNSSIKIWAVALALSSAAMAIAADGELDTGFGSAGKLRLTHDYAAPNDDRAHRVIVTGDTSYVIGRSSTALGSAPTITRLNGAGAPDGSFGNAGTVALEAPLGVFDSLTLVTGRLQNDRKLVLAGRAELAGNTDMLVCRFDAEGEPDETFGENFGCTTIAFDLVPKGSDSATALYIKANGRVTIAGIARGVNGAGHFALAQLNSLGGIDPGFSGGKVTYNFPLWRNAEAAALELDRAGRWLVGGTIHENVQYPCDTDFAVIRLKGDGELDLTYGNQGRTRVGFDLGPTVDDCTYWSDQLAGMALTADGSLFVGGAAQFSSWSLDSAVAVAKLTPNGQYDATFGEGGKTADYVCDVCTGSYPSTFLRRPDGKMLLAGSTYPGTLNAETFVIRMAADGSREVTAFVGFDSAEFADDASDYPNGMAVQYGRTLVVGATEPADGSGNHDMTAVRLDDDYIFFSDQE